MGREESKIPAELIEEHLRKVLPDILREIFIVYSSEDLVTKDEFRVAIESMDKRFEGMLEIINRRFESMDKRFEEMLALMDKRFEAVDKRFEEIIDQMNRRFESMDKHLEKMNNIFDCMDAEIQRGFDNLRRDLSMISTRFDIRLEDIFRDVFREALLTEGLDPDKIRRLDVLDEEGIVVPPGEVTDIYMMATNSQCVFVEVKAHMDMHDIWKFLKTVKIAEEQEGVKATKLVSITFDISPRDRIRAEKMGVRVITSEAGPH